ncbi:MAG: metallophosphoesterase [Peptococcaceae bacterium]|nr:metallophosphoesterase [Peptococcaceae bacterium]
MTFAENVKCLISQVIGQFYIPHHLVRSQETKLLHISDTPTTLYPALSNLWAVLQPEIIVHTGDLADDIKLELNDDELVNYRRAVVPFLSSLESSGARTIYIVPGNHDNERIIRSHASRAQIVSEGSTIQVGQYLLGLAHRFKRLPAGTSYNLYGHNFRTTRSDNGTIYLNGIHRIHVLLIESGKVFALPYPWATNTDRKMVAGIRSI